MRRLTLGGLAALLACAACSDEAATGGPNDRRPRDVGDPPPAVAPQLTEAFHGSPRPLRADFTGTGWLLVTDTRRSAVLRVDSSTLVPDQFLRIDGKPLAVGMLGEEIFVGNETTRSVEVYDYQGSRIGTLGAPGTIQHPTDLAIDAATQQVFVLDGRQRTVTIFDARSRQALASFGSDVLHAPSAIAVDTTRLEVLVSDYGVAGGAASIAIFSYADDILGQPVDAISGASFFSRPRGLAVTSNGRIYLADATLAQVLVLDRSSGALLDRLGSGDPAMSDLRLPTDVTLDPSGRLFVTSPMTESIVAFTVEPGS